MQNVSINRAPLRKMKKANISDASEKHLLSACIMVENSFL